MLEGDMQETFVNYLRAWGDLDISHIQFNVVSSETLLEAQQNPLDYEDLIVRVAGYSAYFVDLSKGLQDSIIARTEQSFHS
jgi:formate C-acetyltransferase